MLLYLQLYQKLATSETFFKDNMHICTEVVALLKITPTERYTFGTNEKDTINMFKDNNKTLD